MAKLSISLGQMRIRVGQVEANFEVAEGVVAGAAGRGSGLVLLPELWTTGYDLERASVHADGLDGGSFARMSGLAEGHGVAIYGSALERLNGAVMNCGALHGSDGRLRGAYRKAHLFRLFDEHKWLGAGDAAVAVEMPWGVTGLSICYDLRFPELFRRYAVEMGARLMLVCAEWPMARVGHWRALLIARAIENQCFVAGVNCCGESGGVVFGGHSMVVDPWGEAVAEADGEEVLLTAEIDLSEAERARGMIPVFADRRPDVYWGGEVRVSCK